MSILRDRSGACAGSFQFDRARFPIVHNWFDGSIRKRKGEEIDVWVERRDKRERVCRVETTTVPRKHRGIYLRSIIGIAWRTDAIAGGCYRAIRAWHRYIYARVYVSLFCSLLASSPWASGTQGRGKKTGGLSYSVLLCYVVTLPSGVMDLAHYRPEHRPASYIPSRTASMHHACAPFLRLFPPRNARHISRCVSIRRSLAPVR